MIREIITGNQTGNFLNRQDKWWITGMILIVVLLLPCKPAQSQIFEYRGEAGDGFNLLDLSGDADILPVTDLSVPPGYGPGVLHVKGKIVMGMAKDQSFTEGTIVALYHENAPEKMDADGIIMFGADYDQDISAAHNTKEVRPHAWFEQDSDCGIQFRAITEEGKEIVLAERCGESVVTDAWNVTRWIWQKIQVDGD
ncbi:MAG: hypothetical protein OEY51_07405, partial [Cyclobacteriaceae bacterium]|nr:hypothetical protein [Cyclobacteriaceae bacterium]